MQDCHRDTEFVFWLKGPVWAAVCIRSYQRPSELGGSSARSPEQKVVSTRQPSLWAGVLPLLVFKGSAALLLQTWCSAVPPGVLFPWSNSTWVLFPLRGTQFCQYWGQREGRAWTLPSFAYTSGWFERPGSGVSSEQSWNFWGRSVVC